MTAAAEPHGRGTADRRRVVRRRYIEGSDPLFDTVSSIERLERSLGDCVARENAAIRRHSRRKSERPTGPDGLLFADVVDRPKFCADVHRALRTPGYRFAIPSSSEAAQRTVWLHALQDQVTAESMKRVLSDVAEHLLPGSVYGWRNGTGNVDALRVPTLWLRANPDAFIVKLDISSAFESVPHRLVIEGVDKATGSLGLVRLTESLVRAQSAATGNDAQGIPRGSNVAPVLMNLALSPFHNFLADLGLANSADLRRPNDLGNPKKRQVERLRVPERDVEESSMSPTRRNRDWSQTDDLSSSYLDLCRPTPISGRRQRPAPYGQVPVCIYGDDVLWIVPGGRDQARRQLETAVGVLADLGLEVSPAKTGVRSAGEGFTFLGAAFQCFHDRRLLVRLPEAKRRELGRKVGRLMKQFQTGTLEERARVALSLESSLAYYAAVGADLGFLRLEDRLRQAGHKDPAAFAAHCLGRPMYSTKRR